LGDPKTRTFAELLIDCEEDWKLRAVRANLAPADAPTICRTAARSSSSDRRRMYP
jgi:hypothetical protein